MLIRFASIERYYYEFLNSRKLVKNLTTRLFVLVPVLFQLTKLSYIARPIISVIMTPLFHLIRSITLQYFVSYSTQEFMKMEQCLKKV